MSQGPVVSLSTMGNALKQTLAGKKVADRYRSQTERVLREVVSSVEAASAAVGAGTLQGRYGTVSLPGGIPADVALGGLLIVAGLFEAAGSASHHLCSFGSGFLTGGAYRLGESLGTRMKARAEYAALGAAPAASEIANGQTTHALPATPEVIERAVVAQQDPAAVAA